MVDHRSEVSGPVQLNCPQTLMVCLQYSLNSIAVWILHVSVLGNKKGKKEKTQTGISSTENSHERNTGGQLHQWELVGHPSIRGQFGAEAQSRKHLVAVVVLNDLADGLQRHGVSVQLVGVHVVQRS